jgi:hypothetical protein
MDSGVLGIDSDRGGRVRSEDCLEGYEGAWEIISDGLGVLSYHVKFELAPWQQQVCSTHHVNPPSRLASTDVQSESRSRRLLAPFNFQPAI